MRALRIHEAALAEAAEAASWYEEERPGLGAEFEHAIEAALDVIEQEAVPLMPVPGREGVKRLVLRRFPYSVVVQQRADHSVVVAFAHHSRRPGYWRDRLRA